MFPLIHTLTNENNSEAITYFYTGAAQSAKTQTSSTNNLHYQLQFTITGTKLQNNYQFTLSIVDYTISRVQTKEFLLHAVETRSQ